MPVVIYHNPRCSKSRETLALIEKKGIKPTVIEYLKTPPSAKELKALLGKLRLKPRGDGREPGADRAPDRRQWRQGSARPPAGGGRRHFVAASCGKRGEP